MKKFIISLLFLFCITSLSSAQNTLRKKHFNLEDGIAIQGYDAVAYFTLNKAVKGSKQFSVLAEGVTYYFSNAANKATFLKDYKKYEPQYGGWCAYAMGQNNEKVEIDPQTFKVLNGKLYLFYNAWGNNTLTKWNLNETKLKANADKNWLSIFK
jgi:YHS domain-containing protein